MSGGVWQQPHPQVVATLGVHRCILTLFVTQKSLMLKQNHLVQDFSSTTHFRLNN